MRNHNINTLRPRQNDRHFPDDIFKRIFLNENVWISIKISPKFVPKGPINNIPALVQIMAWRRPGHKPLSEPKLVSWTTHLCLTRPQWVKQCWPTTRTPHGITRPHWVKSYSRWNSYPIKTCHILQWYTCIYKYVLFLSSWLLHRWRFTWPLKRKIIIDEISNKYYTIIL